MDSVDLLILRTVTTIVIGVVAIGMLIVSSFFATDLIERDTKIQMTDRICTSAERVVGRVFK